MSSFYNIRNVSIGALAGGACAYALYKFYQHWSKKIIYLNEEQIKQIKWKQVCVIKKIWLYPIKSCAPVSVDKAKADYHGFVMDHNIRDRSYMIVFKKEPHQMVTGRMCPQTVLITPFINSDGSIELSFPGMDTIVITEKDRTTGSIITSKVFNQEVKGRDCGEMVAHWLYRVLHREVLLIYCHLNSLPDRRAETELKGHFPLLKPQQDAPLYGDGNSYMLLSQQSVNDLDKRSSQVIKAQRFRPNILVDNCDQNTFVPSIPPYAEDSWGYIRLGKETIMRNVYPCARCVFTCVDPFTGQMDKGRHTLTELKSYRSKKYGEPTFGVNLGVETLGTVKVGDSVYIPQ